MMVIQLNELEREEVKRAVGNAKYEILVAVDPIDQAFKVKVDGGIWSRPMGKVKP